MKRRKHRKLQKADKIWIFVVVVGLLLPALIITTIARNRNVEKDQIRHLIHNCEKDCLIGNSEGERLTCIKSKIEAGTLTDTRCIDAYQQYRKTHE